MFSVDPTIPLFIAATLVVVIACSVLASDVLRAVPPGSTGTGSTVEYLYRFKPLQWAQWLLLAGAAVMAGFLSSQASLNSHALGGFLRWISAGAALQLIGTIDAFRNRFLIDGPTGPGGEPTGWDLIRVTALTVVFLAPTVIGFLRHGRAVLHSSRTRLYALLAAVSLGSVAGGVLLSELGSTFERFGALLDRGLLDSRLEAASTDPRVHHQFVESVIGHSVLVFAAALMMSLVLAAGREVQSSPGTASPSEGIGPPGALTLAPRRVIERVLVALLLCAVATIAVDVLRVPRLQNDLPLYVVLYNDGPVEWSAWFVLAATCVLAALAAGWTWSSHQRASRFFLLMSASTSLMLIEDVGDIRHRIRAFLDVLGIEGPLGLRVETAVDMPYFALLAAIPVYALLRYGRDATADTRVRRFLLLGYGLYGTAALASGLSAVGDLYLRIGTFLDDVVLRGRLALMPGGGGHFYLVDGAIEETVELVAAACLLCAVLAFAGPRLLEPHDSRTEDHAS